MNRAVTSKEEILGASRELIRRQGWSAVSVRSVASACGVSVGTIYNHFGSKEELVGETVESVWREVFHRSGGEPEFADTLACVAWMYERMERGCERYPGFFTLHSLGFAREGRPEGQRRMRQTWRHMREGLRSVIERDARVRPDAFDERLTAEKFADVLFSLMLSALMRQDYDPGAVLEVVRRTLY